MGSTQYKADGVDNISLFYGRIALTFSSDSVQEMSVQHNAFSSEFGRTSGGIVNMTTKSGTNAFHGTLFSSIQNDKLNAAPFVRLTPKGKQRLWRGGGNVGGPVKIPKLYDGHNRTFFFVAYEPLRQSTDQTAFARVPTALERKGDFSQSVYNTGTSNYPVTIFRQFELNSANTLTNKRIVPAPGQPYPQWPGNIIPPQLISKAGEKILALYPLPNMPLDAAGSNYIFRQGVHNSDNRWLFKIDQVVTNGNRLSFRFAKVPVSGLRFSIRPNDPSDSLPADYNTGANLVLGDTYSWGGNKVNEFHAGYSRMRTFRGQNAVAASNNWFADLGMTSSLSAGFPTVAVGNMKGLGTSQEFLEIDNTLQANDHFSWVTGRHSIKVGMEFQAPQQNLTDFGLAKGRWAFNGTFTNIGAGVNTATYPSINRPNATTGFGPAQVLLGFPDNANVTSNVVPYQYRWKYYAGFLADDIKLTPRLTLNVGLRYQVEVPRSEKHHNQGTYVNIPAKTSDAVDVIGAIQLFGLGGYRDTILPIKYNNFEPRLGFAYRLSFGRFSPVIRSAYAITHVPTRGLFGNTAFPDLSPRGSSLATSGGKDGGYANIEFNPVVLPPRLPEWKSNGLFTDLLRVNSPVVFPDAWASPYLQHWNFGLGLEFSPNWALEASYVASKGTNLFGPFQRFNLVNFDAYRQAFLAGVDLTRSIPNPYGVKDANGNVTSITVQDTLRPNPLLGALTEPLTQGYNSSYQSLQVHLRKRFSQGFQFTFAYTFSKSIDEASCDGQFCGGSLGVYYRGDTQLFNASRRLERSVSISDTPHVVSFSYNWELPIGHGKALWGNVPVFLNPIVGGWKLGGVGTLQGGAPWQINLGASAGFPGDYGTLRPDVVLGVPLVNPNWKPLAGSTTVNPYLNPKAFAPPARFTPGTAPRTMPWARRPFAETYDISILKEFRIQGEAKRLEFRVELFDAFNHVNFVSFGQQLYTSLDYRNYVAPPAGDVAAAFSSTAGNTGPQRVIQLGLKFYF